MTRVFSPKKARKRQDPERVRGWNQKHFAGKKSIHIRVEQHDKISSVKREYFPDATLSDVLNALIEGMTETQIYNATKGILK